MSYSVSASQLRKAAVIAQRIEKLQAQLNEILGGAPASSSVNKDAAKPKRKLSAAARAKIAAAQRARWAKQKQKQK
jgi:hypothetical protein